MVVVDCKQFILMKKLRLLLVACVKCYVALQEISCMIFQKVVVCVVWLKLFAKFSRIRSVSLTNCLFSQFLLDARTDLSFEKTKRPKVLEVPCNY